MPDNVFDYNGNILPDAGDKGLIELVLSDTRGIYIPRDFAELYGTDYGITPDDMTILLAGPDHEFYWDTWNSVLSYAEYVDDNGHMWRLHHDGDLFIYRHTDFDTTVHVCTDCNTAYANGMSDAIESMINAGMDPDTVPVPLNRLVNDDTISYYAAHYDAETEAGITVFSKSQCAGCGSHYAGYRYRYAVWFNDN